ncbi:MAG: hypothetical protein AB1758_25890 [Candidatus Eremiobacterota bacterium]
MSSYIRITACALALLLMVGIGSVPGQGLRTYEPFVPTQEFREAFRLVDGLQFAEAVRRFRKIAAENPGTTLGAECLFYAAGCNESEADRRAIYHEIIAGYPGSKFEVQARVCLIEMDIPGGGEPRLLAYDQLARSYGAPPLDGILRWGDRTRLVRQFRTLHTEFQSGLIPVYRGMLNMLELDLRRLEDALRVALFNREAFAFDSIEGSKAVGRVESLVSEIAQGGHVMYQAAPRVDPQVTIRAPRPGHRTGPRPKIRVEIAVGDYRVPQVNLGALEWTLDGQDLKPVMEVRSKIDRSLRLDRPFEQLRLTARPAQRLSGGTHTVSLVVPTAGYQGEGPGIARLNWTFVVARDCDDADDERDDHEDDDRWERDDDDDDDHLRR